MTEEQIKTLTAAEREVELIARWLEWLLSHQLQETHEEYRRAVGDAIQGIRGGWYKSLIERTEA